MLNWKTNGIKRFSACHKTKRTWLQKAAELYASSPANYQNIGKTLQEAFLYDAELDRYDGWVDPLMLVVSAGGPNVTEEVLILESQLVLPTTGTPKWRS